MSISTSTVENILTKKLSNTSFEKFESRSRILTREQAKHLHWDQYLLALPDYASIIFGKI